MNYSDLSTFFISIFSMGFIFYLGYRKGMNDFLEIFKEAAREQGLVIDQDGKATIQPKVLFTEVHNNSLCLYNDDTFVCQGKSLEEIAKVIKNDKKFNKVVVKHEDSFYLLEEGNVIKAETK